MHEFGLVPDDFLINCGGCCVNKTELIEYIAKSADISKAAAARSLDAVMEAITETLKNNGSVTLVGFGTFSVGERAARSGRVVFRLLPAARRFDRACGSCSASGPAHRRRCQL